MRMKPKLVLLALKKKKPFSSIKHALIINTSDQGTHQTETLVVRLMHR